MTDRNQAAPANWVGAIIVVSFVLGMLLAAVVDRWYAPAQATFHVLESGK